MNFARSSALAFALALGRTAAAAGADAAIACSPEHRVLEFPSEGAVVVRLDDSVPDTAELEIGELGQEIALDKGVVAAVDLPIPLRYATRLLKPAPAREVILHRFLPNRAPLALAVSIRCTQDAASVRRSNWLAAVAAIAKRASAPANTHDTDALLTELAELEHTAPNAVEKSIARHVRAQILLLKGESAAATDAFASAETQWLAAGDPARALVARVGEVEDLQRAGKYDRVLVRTRLPAYAGDATAYFRTRLANSRCLALFNLGKHAQSKACYEETLDALRAAGEDVEAVGTRQTYADLLRQMGDLDAAQAMSQQVVGAATHPYVQTIRGRAHLTLMDIALARGDIVAALGDSTKALDDFSGAGSVRWVGNTWLRIAGVYRELGAIEEAYSAVEQAQTRFNLRDSPARMAAAWLMRATLDQVAGRTDEALDSSERSAQLYAQLHMPDEFDSASQRTTRLQLERGDIDAAEAAIARVSKPSPARALLATDIAIRRGNLDEARRLLVPLTTSKTPLSLAIDVALRQADYWIARNERGKAMEALQIQAERLSTLAMAAANAPLRLLMAWRALPLREEAFRIILSERAHADAQSEIGPGDADTIWQWLMMNSQIETGIAQRPADFDAADAARVDRAISADLLTPAPARAAGDPLATAAQKELLNWLADRNDPRGRSRLAAPDLGSLQASFDDDTALLAYVNGHDRGALLWVTRTTVALYSAGSPRELRAAIATLRGLLKSPATPIADIERATTSIAQLLWKALAPPRPPEKLYVLADSALDALPWSVVRWPGSDGALLDTTSVALVRIDRNLGVAAPTSSAPSLHVVTSAQRDASLPSLPPLDTIETETESIRQMTPDFWMGATAGSDATRATILSQLASDGAWVHFAGHGADRSKHLGYAGLWLDASAPGAAPSILGWLEILDRGVRAALVVLNACDLADDGDTANGNLSFSSAVSRAGARQVVAALWPVSDSAAAIWVPAFYKAIVADDLHDAAGAVRAAQLRLRRSRAFAHPFFWASLVSQSRISIP